MDKTILKSKLFVGIFWNSFEKISVKGVSFVLGIVLARLLSPSDYGMIGMLALFISLSQIFIESGFAKALIQKKECSDIDYSTAFYTNIVIAIFMYFVMYNVAPFIAIFYNEPMLKNLLRVLSVNFVLSSFNIVHRAKLMVLVDFKSLAKINFMGTFIGGIVGILLAYNGMGVWALVAQTIFNTLTMLLLFPFFSKWKPLLTFSKMSFLQLFKFGHKLLISSVMSIIFNNASTIGIGKLFTKSDVGFYTRAVQLSELINTVICEVIGTVTFPFMSKYQDDKNRLLILYKKALYHTAMVSMPIMVLISILAKPLVLLLFTEKWLPCVFLLQILCLARMFTPMTSLNLNLLNAIGRSDLYLKLDFIKIPLAILRLLITIPMGVTAVVIGELVDTFICFFINAYYSKKKFNYGAIEQFKDWRYIIISVVIMGGLVITFSFLIDTNWLKIIGGMSIGIVSYISCCYCFKVIDLKKLNFI